ncbi:putative 50S ribosome-binding GTPase [Lyophyllum shimeji]|uniref:50S ribosome-binding GTPase n=1 Tax=Lyophyllum shimeji TaxID=47721 RepID=A0A9P3PQB2_LYOSH|nr:putative 50S ribosome-binding GTPase [Lyophyllum shimeji]
MDFTPKDNDIVIPIMGITGSGKSTFINTLVPEAKLAVGGDVDPCTQSVQPAIIAHPNDAERRVVFIDTPGLDNTSCPDEKILRQITDWLRQFYKDRKLAGIIYLFEISQARVKSSYVLKNLKHFDLSCGDIATKNVILASTKWARNFTDKEVLLLREKELAGIRPGSRVYRFEDSHESAWAIVNLILADAFTFDTDALKEHVSNLRSSLKKGNDQDLITKLEALLQEQNKMAEQLKQAGGVQEGDGGLWDKLVKNDNEIRATFGYSRVFILVRVQEGLL